VLLDTKCQELWSLLQAAQGSEPVTRQDIVRYRREAERHVGQDDNLYKLQWVSPICPISARDGRLRYDMIDARVQEHADFSSGTGGTQHRKYAVGD